MCRYAAGEAGANHDTENTRFILQNEDDEVKRPFGCFALQCNKGGDVNSPLEPCYFVNEGEEEVSDPTHEDFAGTPMCKRKKYMVGLNANSNAADRCGNDDYTTVKNRTVCEELAGPFSFQPAPIMDVGLNNYTRHHDFPEGCFKLPPASPTGMTTVYYNSVSSGTSVTGTSLCEVETPMHWATNTPTGFKADGSLAS
jgi:hypothetical protein